MARTPLYKATETKMLSRITKGDWKVGRRLPNEFELADEFGVSQGTMRRALISLEGMGFLNRKPGRGTLVAACAPRADPVMTPTLVDANGAPLLLEPFRGRTGTRAATSEEADLLGAAKVMYLERTLKSAGTRAAIEEVIVAEGVMPNLSEDAPADLYEHLAAHGVAPARIEAEARAEMTDMSQSVTLSTDRHTALLSVRSTAFDASGTALAIQVLKLALPGVTLVHR